jgi:hypothetical protein
MGMESSPFEIDHILEPVCLPFQRFNLVVDAFDLSACDFVMVSQKVAIYRVIVLFQVRRHIYSISSAGESTITSLRWFSATPSFLCIGIIRRRSWLGIVVFHGRPDGFIDGLEVFGKVCGGYPAGFDELDGDFLGCPQYLLVD